MFDQINAWWRDNAAAGRPSLLQAYSFGKAQRLLAGVDASIGPIAVHPTVEAVNRAYHAAGIDLPPTHRIDALGRTERGRALLITPPSARQGAWLGETPEPAVAFASGWMQVRAARRRPGMDRGFVLSDHADWPGLLSAIGATGCARVIVTHGQEDVLVRWLREQGLDAGRFPTPYGQDEASDNA